MKIVPDTSVIIDGRINKVIEKEKEEVEILIPNAVVSELEYQANKGRETGFDGLDELKLLKEKGADIKFVGEHPSFRDIKYATAGRIDDIIRTVAEENNAILITSDKVQAEIAMVRGINVRYIEPKVKVIKPQIFDLFDDTTMSVHLKENTPIFAKKGSVGRFELVKIGNVVSRDLLNQYARELIEYARSTPLASIELERKGATVLQLGQYRVVIARPPFSDGLEITAVRPIVKTNLTDYKLSDKLLNRLEERAEGVFVAGPPGTGKTTFVQALAEFYHSNGKIIKTMEHPRDLQVSDEITQYGALEGSMEKTGDVLLLVRPDYTIYDELRKTHDFRIFADMRLAGVGMVGVTHASRAIDAIQRLIGRVDLGIIPQVVDTVIFILAGKIHKVYELKMTVKVPYGMIEADLARPVIEVRDFDTQSPEYELYSYGEEIVVIPVEDSGVEKEEEFEITKSKKHIILGVKEFRGRYAKVFVDNEYIITSKVSKYGKIRVRRTSNAGKALIDAIQYGKRIKIR